MDHALICALLDKVRLPFIMLAEQVEEIMHLLWAPPCERTLNVRCAVVELWLLLGLEALQIFSQFGIVVLHCLLIFVAIELTDTGIPKKNRQDRLVAVTAFILIISIQTPLCRAGHQVFKAKQPLYYESRLIEVELSLT